MNLYRQNLAVLIAVALTLLALAGHRLLPEKRLIIHPHPSHELSLYADESWGGQSSARWVDMAGAHWRCDLAQSNVYPVCGMTVTFADKAVDFSAYNSLRLRLKYSGEASKLRIYIRNHNPLYSEVNDTDSMKFNSVTLATSDIATAETAIHLSEFSVAEWWLDEHQIPREQALPEMDRVTTLGIDFPFPQVFGAHNLEIERLELVGPRIEERTYYLGLLLGWMAVMAGLSLSNLRRGVQDTRRL